MSPEEVELLSELTIVMTTYKRPFELEKSIEYWRDTPVTVHILDGSEKPFFPVGSLKRVSNIIYHHMPADKSHSPMQNLFQRILFGSKLSLTKFSAFGCDDDFYTISGLIESLKILSCQPRVDAVAGRVLTYEKRTNLYWHHKYTPRINKTDLETNSIEKKLLTGSSWFLYAVCRTEIWQKLLKTCYEEKNFTKVNFEAHEWMLFILCKAMFKTKYIDIIQQVRQDTRIGWNKRPNISWDEFILDHRNVKTIDEIAKQLASGFNEVTPKSDYAKNLALARDQIRLEQHRALRSIVEPLESKSLKSILGEIIFFFAPGLSLFSDRPRVLKYFWRIPKFQYSIGQKQEIEKIEKLLLKPREELRLRANI